MWQSARALSDAIGGLIRRPGVSGDGALCGQLNAAALSVVANIVEGVVRGGRKEFAQFVRIAAASNGEARALLHAAFGRKHLEREEHDRLVEMTNSVGRMLRVLEARLREPRAT